MRKLLFPGISFLRIVCNIIAFRNIQIFYLRLITGKPYPKFCQTSTMWCVIKYSVAHVLRSSWKKRIAKEQVILLIKSIGYRNSGKLVVLKNS